MFACVPKLEPAMPRIQLCVFVGKPGVHGIPTRASNTFTWESESSRTEQVIPGAESDE